MGSKIQEHHPRQKSKSREISLKRTFNIFTKMKLFVTFLLTAMVSIAMEKCIAKYLLVEVEDEKVPTPRECCENANVPDFCLGLCSPADAMARQGKRITACSKYDTIIEGCFQAAEPRMQAIANTGPIMETLDIKPPTLEGRQIIETMDIKPLRACFCECNDGRPICTDCPK